MNPIHDPYKQIGYIQQCLSSDKRPIGLFLGAGCPTAVKTGETKSTPLIPDIDGITTAVCNKLSQDKEYAKLLKIINGHFLKDGHNGANIEDILTHIRSLRAVAGEDEVRGLTTKQLDMLDVKICEIIQEVVDRPLPHTDTPYHHIALWVDATKREAPVEIFTTNYDLLMEQAFEDCRVPYFDGFAGSRRPFFDIRAMEEDKLPPRWARLWKLHGSINWYQDQSKRVLRGVSNEKGLKRVIHPSHLKYEESRRMPYLAMIDRLRDFLKQPTSSLVLCGYSFRDDHINEVIMQGLQRTQTAIAFALLFDNISSYPKAIKLAKQRANIVLLSQDSAVIGGNETKWPEKDAEAVNSATHIGIEWIHVDMDKSKSKYMVKFTLGDFFVFGQFLHEMTGQGQSAEISYGL